MTWTGRWLLPIMPYCFVMPALQDGATQSTARWDKWRSTGTASTNHLRGIPCSCGWRKKTTSYDLSDDLLCPWVPEMWVPLHTIHANNELKFYFNAARFENIIVIIWMAENICYHCLRPSLFFIDPNRNSIRIPYAPRLARGAHSVAQNVERTQEFGLHSIGGKKLQVSLNWIFSLWSAHTNASDFSLMGMESPDYDTDMSKAWSSGSIAQSQSFKLARLFVCNRCRRCPLASPAA